MSFSALLELVEDGTNTVTVQNWEPEDADFRKFLNFITGFWNVAESTQTKQLVNTPEAGDSYSTIVDVSAAVSGETALRLIYRDSGGQCIGTEYVRVDDAGDLFPVDAETLAGVEALTEQSANFTENEKAELIDILGITGTGTPENPRAGFFDAMTEEDTDGNLMFTSKALEKTYRIPAELDVVQSIADDAQVTVLYRITKTLAYVPDEADNIVATNIYRTLDPTDDPSTWELHRTVAYTQGDEEVVFDTQYTGFFKMAFVDGEGEVGQMSETFSVHTALADVDLKFKLEKDSKTWIVGDQRYLTIEAIDREDTITTLPAARMSVMAPDGTYVVNDVLALVDGMYVKHMLVTDSLTPGTYKCRCKVLTNFEVIQSTWFEFALSAAA